MPKDQALKTVVVGAGGLGGPIALALSALGHAVSIYDPDVVALSNLQRQTHFAGAVGQPKATVLADRINARATVAGATATATTRRWTAHEPARNVALIVDATDSPATKFAVAQWAMHARLPYVIAAAVQRVGTVFVGGPSHACYECLFEDPPADAVNCDGAGILGAAVAIVGGTAARLAHEVLTGTPHWGLWQFADVGRAPRHSQFAIRATCRCDALRPGHRVLLVGGIDSAERSVRVQADDVATALTGAALAEPRIARLWDGRNLAPHARVAIGPRDHLTIAGPATKLSGRQNVALLTGLSGADDA